MVVQRGGHDGSYRMTIDKKYSSLPTLRKAAKLLWPVWLMIICVKIGYVAAPFHSAAESADAVFFGVLVGSALLCMCFWFIAGVGSKKEYMPSLILFNIALLVSTVAERNLARVQNTVKGVSQHVLSDEGASNIEVTAATNLLQSYVPSTQNFKGLDSTILQVSTGVDAALFVTAAALFGCLQLYIKEKKGGSTTSRKTR